MKCYKSYFKQLKWHSRSFKHT